MLQDSCECDPNALSLGQPKVLDATDYIRNINKQLPDFDPIYKHIVRSEASNIINKTTVINVVDALFDHNVIKNTKVKSGRNYGSSSQRKQQNLLQLPLK